MLKLSVFDERKNMDHGDCFFADEINMSNDNA